MTRLAEWLQAHIEERIKPLVDLATAEDVQGLARGVAFRLVENFGVLKRESVSDEIRSLDQDARGQLRKYGVRFGAFNIYIPVLLKPAPVELTLLLWALFTGKETGLKPEEVPEPPRQGLTSAVNDPKLSDAYYRVSGFHRCGNRVVRIDMLERLADMIRPLVSWRTPRTSNTPPKAQDAKPELPAETPAEGQATEAAPEQKAPEPKPEGATGDGGFRIQPDMMSIVGCSGEDFASVLRTLGFRCERRRMAAPDAPKTDQAPPQVDAADQAAPPAEAAEDTKADDTAAETAEPVFDEIWRPKRKRPVQGRGQANRDTARQGKGQRRDGAKKKRPQKRTGAPRKGKPKSRERDTVDPDSPFAALQKLKQDMESGVREDA